MSAARLSSQKKIFLGRLALISAMTFSALRKRYLRPNIAVTEQKVHPKGQPQLVMIGTLVILS